VVLAADAAARRAGLRVGMPATKAQALVVGLVIMDADPAADDAALDRLALWALQRYAPIAAADPPDGLIIDVTGFGRRCSLPGARRCGRSRHCAMSRYRCSRRLPRGRWRRCRR
jgi:hypothetical protein